MQSLSESLARLQLSHKIVWHEQLLREWKTIAGPFAKHARLERVLADRIIIGVYDPRWVVELHSNQALLLERMRNTIPAIPVDMTIVCVWARPAPVRVHVDIPVQSYEQVGLVSLTDEQHAALRSIADAELRSMCVDYWQRCAREQQGQEEGTIHGT